METRLKTPCKGLAAALAALSAAALSAGVPLNWDVTPDRARAATFDRYHGETLDLTAWFRGFGTLPFAGMESEVRLWYQTNGMGNVWWSAPATVASNTIHGAFTPAMDPGADTVTLFFGAYSNAYAAATVKLRHSPMYVTNPSLPVPSANVPHPEGWETVSNRAMNAVQSIDLGQGHINIDLTPLTDLRWIYADPDDPESNITHRAKISAPFDQYGVGTGGLGTFTFYGSHIDEFGYLIDYHSVLYPDNSPVATSNMAERIARQYAGSGGGGEPGDYAIVSNRAMNAVQWDSTMAYAEGRQALNLGYLPVQWWSDWSLGISPQGMNAGKLVFTDLRNSIPGLEYLSESVLMPDGSPFMTSNMAVRVLQDGLSTGTVAVATAATNYTDTAVAAVSNLAATAAGDAATALRIVLGENAWFAVTNYMRTAEGVSPSLQLWEVRDGATNLVYDSREEVTNTVRQAAAELRTDMTNRIEAVRKDIPSRAWGRYQSGGTDNPQPGEVAIVNEPTVILTGGGAFNRYLTVGDSSVWALKASGPVAFGGGTNGNFFAVVDDEGKEHFRVAKTDSYDLPAIFSDVLPRRSDNSILLYVAHTNSLGNAVAAPPVLSACDDLREFVWHAEENGEVDALGLTVTWTKDETIPAWVARVTPDAWPPRLFFRAKVVQEGVVAVINTAPARFDGGIQIDGRVYRIVPYTNAGKTYLVLE